MVKFWNCPETCSHNMPSAQFFCLQKSLHPTPSSINFLKNENGRDPTWGQPSHVVALVLLLKKIKINCPILIRIQKLFLQDLNSFHVGIRENTEAKYRAIIIKSMIWIIIRHWWPNQISNWMVIRWWRHNWILNQTAPFNL